MKPIIINFKAYRNGTCSNAINLAKIHEHIARKTRANIMIAVQNADIYRVSRAVSIPVLAQHADPVGFGKHTGSALPEGLKYNGAWGALINHSEDRMPLDDIKETIKRCKQAGLKTVACAESMEKASEIAKIGPDFIAFEDPELIGTGRSVSRLEPESVRKFALMVNKTNAENTGKTTKTVKASETIPLCGAGISSGQDVAKAIELGVRGVLVSSAVVEARNPSKILEDFAKAIGTCKT